VTTLSAKDVRDKLELLVNRRISVSNEFDLSNVVQAFDRFQDAQSASLDSREIREADMLLHRSFCLASKNDRLVNAWDDLLDQIRLAIATVNRLDGRRVASMTKVHADVVEAMKERDWPAALLELERHLSSSRDALMDSIAMTSGKCELFMPVVAG
jgi:DNA-binding GntR family transcriptional regulator